MHFFLRHPRFVISAITILTIFLGAFIPFMELDNEVTRMIPADDPHKTFFDQTHEKFGLSNTVIVGIVSQDSVFRSDLLEKASFFCDTFETLKNVSDLLSVSRTNYIEGDSMGLVVGPLFETMPHTGPEMQEFKRRVFGWEVFRNSLVSEDGKALIIGIRYPKQRIVNGINQRLSDLEKLELYTSIRKIIDANPIPHAHLYVAGEPAVISLITKQMQHDIAMLVPLVFIVVVILLLLSIGNIGGVCLILSSITISLIWTMGLMSLLGIRMSLISTSIPVLLVAIGSAYAIHIIHRYYHERTNGLGREEALNTTLSNVGVAVLMAALTTMAGFGSLITSSIVPIKEFGSFTAVGTFTALVVSVLLIPAVLSVFPDRWFAPKQQKAMSFFDEKIGTLLPVYMAWVLRHRVFVLLITIAILAVSGFLATRLTSDNVMVKYFKKNSEIRIADEVLNSFIGGTSELAVVITGKNQEVFRNPGFLVLLDTLQTRINTIPGVGKTISFANYIKRIHRSMNNNSDAFSSIPASPDMIAQYLLLISYEDYETLVDESFTEGRIVVQIKEASTDYYRDVIKKIQTLVPAGMKEYADISMTGTADLMLTVNRLVVKGQISSIIASAIIVLLLSAAVFRSITGGLLTIVPLTVAVVINFGVMGFLGIPLEVGTALTASIAIGVGVDYAIHYINSVKKNAGDARGPSGACEKATRLSGSAILFNALSVAAGFLVLNLSSFIPLIRLGNLIALTMVTASCATLTLLPILMQVIKPRFLGK
ncbi:MAG: hypothetical protein A2268_10050 [Candidatus Raymondbacteria bacterium RifOxyA12_full_50_37]|nr:MAG: hypothetical protein A2268_10050 [Candidatus Raymondbacteria bacterium RifOxyA12_full_50_37]OGJ93820.1 MAG: hypothetical protein A2248_06250 [Candidatus Raymondbacteria bacterium RIFOXYA2_FULL_49_16]OGJ98313.1 MAG: hypothetical protein A2453_00925 [Candidatus Raymondbacteria bacterium RIFOXYC2_FULL_50_21]OGP45324.1 MAG: hypothetical protein A2324_22010 [Candidatus Raymondbacteria bacterium RIFOXYB2_FULL_49_35]